jgi:molybdopterin adenylyltransferase
MSSRLLSAKSSNGFVILPRGTPDIPVYHCSGQTQLLLFGPIVNKSTKEIQALIDTNEGQAFKPSCPCCVSKSNGSTNKQEEVKVNSAPISTPVSYTGDADFKVGLITVSDRASLGQYPTGDLSGQAMRECCESYPNFFGIAKQVIVDDSKDNIREAMLSMVGQCNLVFTSGGTGFFERDNTPEVTSEIIEKRADALMVYVTQESCKIVPTACLSRAIIGSKGKTLIVNLPGKPKAVKENFEILMRKGILIHALG